MATLPLFEQPGVLIFATNLTLTFLIGRSAFAVNNSSHKSVALLHAFQGTLDETRYLPASESSSGCAQSYIAPSHDRLVVASSR